MDAQPQRPGGRALPVVGLGFRCQARLGSERLEREEVLELAAALPPQLQGWLLESEAVHPKRFGPEKFVRRVAERTGEDERTSTAQTVAVFVALGRLVRQREMQALAHQLPSSYRRLIGEALHRPREPRAPEVLGIKEFMRRVEDRIGAADAEEAV